MKVYEMMAIDRKNNDVWCWIPQFEIDAKMVPYDSRFILYHCFLLHIFVSDIFLFFVTIYFVLMTSVLYQKYKHNSLSFFILIGMQDLTLKQWRSFVVFWVVVQNKKWDRTKEITQMILFWTGTLEKEERAFFSQ